MNKTIRRGVILTPRDYCILSDLYHYTVMSFMQLKAKSFTDVQKATALNRLTKLERRGYIQRRRVPRFLSSAHDLQISVVYQITKSGIRELQKHLPDKALRTEPVKLSAFSLDHDLLLNDVMDQFSYLWPNSQVTNAKLLDTKSLPDGINPDATLEKPNSNTRWAIELELSLKSEHRYRNLVLKYRTQSDIQKVIYVTQNKVIESKLIEVVAYKPIEGIPTPSTDRFYFTSLDELMKSQSCPKIFNGEDTLSPEGGNI